MKDTVLEKYSIYFLFAYFPISSTMHMDMDCCYIIFLFGMNIYNIIDIYLNFIQNLKS